ncbi:MAG: DUF5103 domain-containing protein [Ignavibacteria bacterium]|nr:DUF5103 domain-containing protein [Ignavibacteria bacterium]
MFIYLVFILLVQTLSAQNLIEVKGLRTYSIKDEILPPIIIYNDLNSSGIEDTSNDYIIIEFDLVSQLKPNLQIIFQLCDKNWKPIDNIFLQNFGKDRFYNLQFRNAPNGVKTYNYTFRQRFPDERGQITFPYSGKYKFLITDFNDDRKIYGEGYFVVVYQKFPVSANFAREVIDDSLSEIMEFNRRQKILVNVEIPKPFDIFRQNEIEIVQNQKFFFSTIINFNRKTRYEFGRYLKSNVKQYIKRDFYGGNEYRQLDLTDIRKYPNDRLLTSFTGIDVTRKFNYGGKDFNGGALYYRKDDIYNEYLDYRFELTLPYSVDGEIYVIGSFNNWRIDEKYKMERRGNYYSLVVNLKRGVYDYQYVCVKENYASEKTFMIDWVEVEGNNWNTKNSYYIFVYYNNPDYGGWDEIVGFAEVKT